MTDVKSKLNEIYRELEVNTDLSSFSNRKLLQKLTYLIEVFGINLGFKFSWYVHGPYDRHLTSVLYDDSPEESNRSVSENSNQSQCLKNLKEFLGNDITSSRNLELIVSLHYLNHIGKKDNLSDNEIITKLLKLKPQFSREESLYYLKRIHQFFP